MAEEIAEGRVNRKLESIMKQKMTVEEKKKICHGQDEKQESRR